MSGTISIIGEIHTGLLHHSHAVSPHITAALLQFVAGEQILQSQRPARYACSPELVTGVDCDLPNSTGAAVRAVGTALSRAGIAGGRAVQASAWVEVARSDGSRRLPWSHYLARRGRLEAIGRVDGGHVSQGFLAGPEPGQLDLGAIASRTLNRVQNRTELDHAGPFRGPRGRLRWVVNPGDEEPSVRFSIGTDTIRRLRLPFLGGSAATYVSLCEDIALHDWLLTNLMSLIERGLDPGRSADGIGGLRQAVDHLLHLWMPGARTSPILADIWTALDRQPGLTRQWQVNVDRVRDQLALRTLERLTAL